MSDQVIRDAVVRLRLEQQKTGLVAPDTSGAVTALNAEARAAREAAKARNELADAARRQVAANEAVATSIRTANERLRAERVSSFRNERIGERMMAGDGRLGAAIAGGAADESQQAALVAAGNQHETFARKAEQSWALAGRGALQYTRGLAMLATSSGEVSQKMMSDLIAIEGASQLTMGAANLTKFAKSYGTLGLAVTGVGVTLAGAVAAWDIYNSGVEKGIKENEEFVKSLRTKTEALKDSYRAEDSVRFKGESSAVDANFSPAARRSEQDRQLAEIRGDRSSEAAKADRYRAAGRDASARQAAASHTADTLPDGLKEALDQRNAVGLGDWVIDQLGFHGLLARHRESAAEAEAAKAAKESAGKDLRRSLESQVESAGRERQLLEEQHSDRINEIKEREQQQLEGLHRAQENESPAQSERRKADDWKFIHARDRARGAVTSVAQAGAVFGGFGMPSLLPIAFSQSGPQDYREGAIHSQASRDETKINEQYSKMVQNVIGMMTNFNAELERIKGAANH